MGADVAAVAQGADEEHPGFLRSTVEPPAGYQLRSPSGRYVHLKEVAMRIGKIVREVEAVPDPRTVEAPVEAPETAPATTEPVPEPTGR